jgi:hypothetical protein
MCRFCFLMLIVLSLAACSSAPNRDSRSGSAPTGDAWRTMPPGAPHFVDHSDGREEISIEAMSLVGIPYRWGGNSPASGFDCSGLVRYVIRRAADVELPRTTAEMSKRGTVIEPDDVSPGDLIFFNTTGRPHSHVGIYVGDLQFVNAPSTGGTVRIDKLSNPYWAKHFDGIRRVALPLEQPTPSDTPTYVASPPQRPLLPAPDAPSNDTAGTGLDSIDAAAGAQVMRASTSSTPEPAPSATSDDPIARFATGGD